jgi:signal transduction histidine kinase
MRRTLGPFGTTDVLFAGAFSLAAAVEALVRAHDENGDLALGLGGAVAMSVLLVRRRHPLVAMTLFCVSGAGATVIQTQLLEGADDSFVPILALIVLSFALGAHGSRRDLVGGAPQPVALVALVDLLEPGQGLGGALVFVSTFVVLLPVVAGRLVRARRRMVTELRRLEQAAAREHPQRLRIARAEESLAVAEMLDQTLEAGLEELLDADDIEVVERRARELLATTRDAVVGLARDDESGHATTREDVRSSRPGRVSAMTDNPGTTWTLLVAAAVGTGLVSETSPDWSRAPTGLALTALVVGCVAMIARRPLLGTLAAWAAASAYSRGVVNLGDTFTGIGLTVALPFLASWLGERRHAAIAVGGGLTAAVLGVRMDDPAGAAVLTALATAGGLVLHDHSVLLAELRAARTEAAARREAELRIAALEERAALGRELHDSIGHALTVVALQAGAARRLRTTDPVASAGAREAIERTARQALLDLRRQFETDPDGIAGLVDTARAAGLEVDLTGPPPPQEIAAVVHRVIQEALTNVLRHAPGARVQVVLGEPDTRSGYTCRVRNSAAHEAAVPAAAYPSAGRGLTGMRARVEEVGGTVRWGRVGTGFEVSARFAVAVEALR